MYEYRISQSIDDDFTYHIEINDKVILNYESKNYVYTFEENDKRIMCYGYCFDIRNPNESVKETLITLLQNNDLEKDLNYLNGHFIIIYTVNNDSNLYTDASSITPVYFSKEDYSITNQTINNYIILNPNFKLNVTTLEIERFTSLSNYQNVSTEDLHTLMSSLLQNQFKYFKDKNLNIMFQADNFHKALFAILSPVLSEKNILVNKIDKKGFNSKFGETFAKEFYMNYYEIQDGEDEYPLSNETNILVRNNLSNYDAIYNKKSKEISNDYVIDFYNISDDNKYIFNFEFNLINNYLKSNNKYKEYFLIYEPLNTRELLSVFVELNNREDFNSNLFAISEFKPSLNFYNFTNGKNLREVNLTLKEENLELKSNSMTSQNQKFLTSVKLTNFTLSQNLDGKLKNEELLVYPAKKNIKKNIEYKIDYKNIEDGLILVKSFYKNEKNAKRIVVTVNEEIYNINDFYDGIYFYTDEDLNITYRYTQDYNNLSWQKAGTLLVKKIK